MNKGDNTGRGLFPLSQLSEEQPPVAQDVKSAHLPDASPLSARDSIQDNGTVPTPEKLPDQRTQLRARPNLLNVSLKDFKELMIRARLDDWKLRAQVVHTPGQVDITALWSPQIAGIKSARHGMISFDGFDRTWFVPFDSEMPLPAGKQSIADDIENRRTELSRAHFLRKGLEEGFHDKLKRLFEDEVKETCQSHWDRNFGSYMAPMQWDEVRQKYELIDLVTMIAEARLKDGIEPLPGYYEAMILELGIDGKITFQRKSVPSDIDMRGLISRLESWYPRNDEHSTNIIKYFRHKLDYVSDYGDETQKRKCQLMLRQLSRFVDTGKPECELSQWVFKLWCKPDYSVPAGKSPDKVGTWTRLKENKYQDLLAGVINKYPVFVRKIRVRRWWSELRELEKQIETSRDETEFSAEQLAMLDKLLARRIEEQDAKSKEALSMTNMVMIRSELPSVTLSTF
ncbi:hypothetical protein EDB82DRAFT_529054 [Fusarium venenatum]|uniref:uncharacterized protein n=1 Tax=Fusarium venenatum TaxID=56646 RepID=UPI001D59D021|nr:hypothetical protein EDB82DRAFT_529054 [Fusarium venenatum]